MQKTLGVYIHIPFCASKCAYCDFYSLAGAEDLMPVYQQALLHHIRESAPQLAGYLTDTVYFGGGTPSFYGASRLIEIFDALKQCGRVLVDAEVTAEMNPDTTEYRDLVKMRRAGFNRISFGVQSACDRTLRDIGRRHDFARAEKAVKDAREAGFENVSVDIMYGLPSQTRDEWAKTIVSVAALQPDHISCYGLKIEEGTPLYPYKDSPFIPDDDEQADMYLYAVQALERLGYRQYEISNFARRGFESKHNLKYWLGGDYMGFGAAAHSFVGSRRYSFYPSVAKYIEGVSGDGRIVDQAETITAFERSCEYLMLGLRTVHGISEAEYQAIYPCSFEATKELLAGFVQNGWAVQVDDRWHFTPNGFLISNVLIGQVLDTQTGQRRASGTPWIVEAAEEEGQLGFFTQNEETVSLFNGI